MDDERDTLSEPEALRLWQRAAELQAEAARRAEARAAQGEHESGDEDLAPRRDGDGYALVHVRAAALEAGIGEEFVDAALTEVRAGRAVARTGGAPSRPISRWVMGNPAGSVVARRDMRATPRAILAAMEEVVPHDPFRLSLRNRVGDPLQGGVLVFDIQGASFTGAGEKGFTGEASWADLRQVLVTLAPHPGTPPTTSVTVTAPVAWAWRLNAGLTLGLSTLGGVMGFVLVGAVAGGLGFLGPVGAGLLAALSGTAAASGTLTGFRALHRYSLGRGERALDGLLAAVAARAEGGWGIAPKDDERGAP